MSTCPPQLLRSVLAQLHCAYCQTNFRSRPNMSRLSPHAKGCHTYVLFPICPICLIPLHWQLWVTVSSLFNSFLHVTHPLYIARLEQNEKTAFFSFLLR